MGRERSSWRSFSENSELLLGRETGEIGRKEGRGGMRREKRLWVACNKFGPFSSNFPSCHSPREVVDFSVIHGK